MSSDLERARNIELRRRKRATSDPAFLFLVFHRPKSHERMSNSEYETQAKLKWARAPSPKERADKSADL